MGGKRIRMLACLWLPLSACSLVCRIHDENQVKIAADIWFVVSNLVHDMKIPRNCSAATNSGLSMVTIVSL